MASLSDALTTSAGITTGGSALSGILGLFGQSSANKAMLQATRETNEQNYKIWQESMDHDVDMFNMENQANIDMWNMQNEYNDPSAQMERLAAAGLNPYLAMSSSSNSTGVATSAPASASVNKSQAPTMQTPPTEAFTNPVTIAFQQAINNAVQLSQTFDTLTHSDVNKSQTGLNYSNIDLNAAYEKYYGANTN